MPKQPESDLYFSLSREDLGLYRTVLQTFGASTQARYVLKMFLRVHKEKQRLTFEALVEMLRRHNLNPLRMDHVFDEINKRMRVRGSAKRLGWFEDVKLSKGKVVGVRAVKKSSTREKTLLGGGPSSLLQKLSYEDCEWFSKWEIIVGYLRGSRRRPTLEVDGVDFEQWHRHYLEGRCICSRLI